MINSGHFCTFFSVLSFVFVIFQFIRRIFFRKRVRLTGSVCIITGASNGIGLELSKKLLAVGNSVVNLDIEKPSKLTDFERDEIYLFIRCDVSD